MNRKASDVDLLAFLNLPNEYTVLDLETTGFKDALGEPGIVTIGLARVQNGEVVKTTQFFVRPYRKISEQATKVHGYSNAQVFKTDQRFKPFTAVWPKVKAWLDNQTIVMHNKAYDWNTLDYAIERYDVDFPASVKLFCSMESSCDFSKANGISNGSRGPGLDKLLAYFGIDVRKGKHDAEEDVRLTALVVERLRERAESIKVARATEIALDEAADELAESTQKSSRKVADSCQLSDNTDSVAKPVSSEAKAASEQEVVPEGKLFYVVRYHTDKPGVEHKKPILDLVEFEEEVATAIWRDPMVDKAWYVKPDPSGGYRKKGIVNFCCGDDTIII